MTACEVWPNIYVGDLTAAHFFIGPKLSVREQPADYLFKSHDDLCLGFKYGHLSDDTLRQAVEWLDEETKKNRPILVHCSGGLHRSAIVVAYWIATRYPGIHPGGTLMERVKSAYAYMRISRPEIEPRPEWLEGDRIER